MSNESGPESMVMTVLEAHVAADQWAAITQAYTQGFNRLPSQMVQTFLVQSTADPTLWRGISIWRSRNALEEYRQSVATPGGVLMFRSVGAEPTLTILEVVAEAHPAI